MEYIDSEADLKRISDWVFSHEEHPIAQAYMTACVLCGEVTRNDPENKAFQRSFAELTKDIPGRWSTFDAIYNRAYRARDRIGMLIILLLNEGRIK